MRFLIFIGLWSLPLLADPVVLKAFRHPSGFILFEVVSQDTLKQLQQLQARGEREGEMFGLRSGSDWYFGRADGNNFRRLLPGMDLFHVKSNEIDINFNFVAVDSSGAISHGVIKGEITRDPSDKTAPLEGKIEVSCGTGSSACFSYDQKLVGNLSKRIGAMVLADTPKTARVLGMLLKDASGNLYVSDKEVFTEYDPHRTKQHQADYELSTAEFLRIRPSGEVEFLDIKSFSEPAQETVRRSDGKNRQVPVQEIAFTTGEKFIETSYDDGNKMKFISIDGSETALQGAFQDTGSRERVSKALRNRYQISLVNPCEAISRLAR